VKGRAKPPNERLPKCCDCGEGDVFPYHVGHGHIWLCGSCAYKREHPDAAPAVALPRERPSLPLQGETLFDVETL
jgi:hypothetical protein